MNDITAVLAANRNLPLVEKFYTDFRKRFPTQPVAISCLGGDFNISEYIRSLEDQYTRVTVGQPKDGHTISFSESYNGAINLVQTPKLVLIHNDMIIPEDFFDVLSRELEGSESTLINYATFQSGTDLRARCPRYWLPYYRDIVDFENARALWKTVVSKTIDYQETIPEFFVAGYRSDFEKVGGFDQETFLVYSEEDGFPVRAELAGLKTYMSKRACVYHSCAQTSGMLGETQKRVGESVQKFKAKWDGYDSRKLYMPDPEDVREDIIARFGQNYNKTNYLKLQQQREYT